MPRGARPLNAYDRYYSSEQMNGREVLVGVFLLRSAFETRSGAEAVGGIPNAFTIARRPRIADGGCSVVTIYFDQVTQRLLPIQIDGADAERELAVCNGSA